MKLEIVSRKKSQIIGRNKEGSNPTYWTRLDWGYQYRQGDMIMGENIDFDVSKPLWHIQSQPLNLTGNNHLLYRNNRVKRQINSISALKAGNQYCLTAFSSVEGFR